MTAKTIKDALNEMLQSSLEDKSIIVEKFDKKDFEKKGEDKKDDDKDDKKDEKKTDSKDDKKEKDGSDSKDEGDKGSKEKKSVKDKKDKKDVKEEIDFTEPFPEDQKSISEGRDKDHISSVSSRGVGVASVGTHGGSYYDVYAKDTDGKMPKLGEHISKYVKGFKGEVPKEVKEETEAASSLHPAAKSISDDKAISASKVGMMKSMMHMMGGMEKGDMISFFNTSMSQFGPGKDHGVPDKSDSNKATLNMKPSLAVGKGGASAKEGMPKLSVKEDVETMFEGETLSEEFKEKVSTLFEAAIATKLSVEVARLEEENEIFIKESLDSYKEELTAKIDTYLNYVSETWMKDNEVAIESTIRNELSEEFMDGLKNLFAEHYINVPQEKMDIVTEMAKTISELEESLDKSITETKELKGVLANEEKNSVFETVSEGLTVSQKEKFSTMAEGIEFSDIETFEKKLKIIKETYFKKKTPLHNSNIIEESFEGNIDDKKVVSGDPLVNSYANYMTKMVKN